MTALLVATRRRKLVCFVFCHKAGLNCDHSEQTPVPLKRYVSSICRKQPLAEPWIDCRDRENCTIFVADLPAMVTEDDLTNLFKDVRNYLSWISFSHVKLQCGKIREVKITPLPNIVVATVEFFERVRVLSQPVYGKVTLLIYFFGRRVCLRL